MISFIFVLVVVASFVVAGITTFFTFIPTIFPEWRFRHHLPFFGGLIIVAFIFAKILQPASLQYLLLPLFLYAPLPYFKKWRNIEFSKVDVFLGAMLAADCYFAFTLSGGKYFEEFWLIDSVLWIAGSFIIAFLIYAGIALFEKYLSHFPEESASSEDRKDSEIYEMNMKKVAGIVLAIFLLWLPFGIIGEPEGDMCGGTIPVDSIEPSTEVSAIPNTTIIHLTEEDFKTYPELGSYLKKDHVVFGRYEKTFGGKKFTVESLLGIHFRCGSESRMYDYRALENWEEEQTKFVGYNGKIYYLGVGYIA